MVINPNKDLVLFTPSEKKKSKPGRKTEKGEVDHVSKSTIVLVARGQGRRVFF
jgi:hypothetical protein